MNALDYTPDADLAQRIRDGLPNHARPAAEGDVLGWVVIDPDTGEWCVACRTRSEARVLAGAEGVIAKIVRAH